MPKWTEEQQSAIDLEGNNIIVSAGAGSGKTAVLTARVLRKLKSGVHINELLILTFTKAAASEMRERIRSAIKKEPSLSGELDLIDSAYITTFDSYALSIVRKYHDTLNVSKSISVIDHTIITSLKKQYLDQIFDTFYEKQDPKFLKLIGDFCLRDDTEIKEMILSISSKLDLRFDKEEYLKTYVKTNFREEKIQKDIEDYVSFIKQKIEDFHHEIKMFSTYVDGDYIEKLENLFDPVFHCESYDDLVAYKMLKFPTLPRGLEEEVKEKKKALSELWSEITSYLSYSSSEEIKETVFLTKDYVEIIVELILELEHRIRAYKYQKDAYEFTDIALLAIQIVREQKEVREELKYHFKEIMIDEYQDTSDLQEAFIEQISNHNVYMVGDIKQSIYRFRNANPYLFKSKYDLYQKNVDGYKIDLKKNFRSRKEVLENINCLFDYFMDNEIGGAQYRESHEMVFGNDTYIKEGKTDQNYDFEIYNYTREKDNPYKNEEIEAFIIASDIQNKVINHYQIFDKDKKILRDIEYSDCVILMDRATNFDLFKKIFEYMKIPLTLYKDESITNEVDIYVLKNILKFLMKIKKKEFDQEFQYCYTSIARSFLFSISDQEILETFLRDSFKETEIYQIAFRIVCDLENLTCLELLKRVWKEFSFYEKIITLGNIENALVRFEYLENVASNFTTLGYTIFEFTDYLEEMITDKIDIRYASNSTSSNSCKMMTIHKSKGLEFPICYFAMLSKKFNTDDLKERFLYDSKYGIVTPYYNDGVGTLFYKAMIKENYLKEEVSEKIRLFYVALTRAKEKMIFVTSLPLDGEMEKENGLVVRKQRLKYRSFQDMLVSILPVLQNYRKEMELEQLPLSKDYMVVEQKSILTMDSKEDTFLLKEFPLEEKKAKESHFSKETFHLVTEEEKRNMEFGTKLHEVLEYLDFKNPDFTHVPSFYQKLLLPFFNLPFMKEIQSANVYKEYEFYDPDTLTHGIIDLLLEFEDKILIIDYKLKNIDDSAYQKQLKGYQSYIQKKTNKKVFISLYSIMDGKLEEIV